MSLKKTSRDRRKEELAINPLEYLLTEKQEVRTLVEKLKGIRDKVDLVTFSALGIAATYTLSYCAVPSLGFVGDLLIRGILPLPAGVALGQYSIVKMAEYADADDTPVEEPTTLFGKARKILNNEWVFGKTLTTPLEKVVRGYQKSKNIVSLSNSVPEVKTVLRGGVEDLTRDRDVQVSSPSEGTYTLDGEDYTIQACLDEHGEVLLECSEKNDPRYLKKSSFGSSLTRGQKLKEVSLGNNLSLRIRNGRVVQGEYMRGLDQEGYHPRKVQVEGIGKEVLEFIGQRYKGFLEALPSEVRSRIFPEERRNSSMKDQLIKEGIPERFIETNKELSDYIAQIERNEVVSANKNFYVTDKDGQKWMLKFSNDPQRSKIEAAANYYLSRYLSFIVPGESPEPMEANGIYCTKQRDVSSEINMERPIEYWITSLALFHREAERIFDEAGIVIPTKKLYSIDELVDRYVQTKKRHNLDLDRIEMAEAIDYLTTRDHYCIGHGDAKADNLFGSYLIDLEGCSRVHPGIDLSLILMRYGVPKEDWDLHLKKYLEVRGYEGNLEQESKELREGTLFAAQYMATKEVIAASLRKETPHTRASNELLEYQLNA